MVRVSPSARSAASGEISRLMLGRPDYVRYQNGLLQCRGFIPMPEGPVTRCPGTEMLGEIRANSPARLMPFIFRDEDAVLLEWTDGWVRFWRNGTQVMDGQNVYEIETPYDLAASYRLQSLQSNDRIYLTEGTQAPQRLSRFAIDSWTIEKTPFENGPFAAQNDDQSKTLRFTDVDGAFRFTALEQALGLPDLQDIIGFSFATATMEASVDMFLPGHVGALFKLRELDRVDVGLWSGNTPAKIGDTTFYNGRHYLLVAFDFSGAETASAAPTVNGSGEVTASGNVIWEAVEQNNSGNHAAWQAQQPIAIGDRRFVDGWTIAVVGFDIGDNGNTGVNPPTHSDGRALVEKDGPVWEFLNDESGIVEVTKVVTPQRAKVQVIKTVPRSLQNIATYRWSEGAWSDVKGWPRAIGSFQQRHVYGGTPSDPRGIWTSVIGGTVNMQANGLDDDGFSYILDSDTAAAGEIRWIVGAGGLLHVGTTANEFYGRATDSDRAFAELTARFDSDTARGVADIPPVNVNGTPVFVHKNLRRLIRQAINPNTGRFNGDDLTKIARHILGSGVSQIVYQDDPIPTIWAVATDGDLVGLTYIPEEEALGFHRHNLAGGHVRNIAVMPSQDGLSEELYLQISRQINGQTRNFLERMKAPFVDLDGSPLDLQDAWFVWCGKRYQGPATTVIDGLDHLEGEDVIALTTEGVVTDVRVENGQIVLLDPVTSAIVGLDASDLQEIETLDIVIGAPDGGDEGRLRTHRVTGVSVHETAGGQFQVVGQKAGRRTTTQKQSLFNLDAFEDPGLRNGVFEIAGHKGWKHQTRLRFTPEPGLPMTIMSRTPTIMVTDS